MKRGVLALLLFALTSAFTVAAAPRPDLVVVVSLDQFRFDYVERFAPWFTTRGFQRFVRDGATFTDARYRYSATFTGPGHASIGTGLLPAESGIIGNNWFETDAATDADAWAWYFDDNTTYRAPDVPQAEFDAAAPDAWWKAGGTPRYCVYDDRVTPTAGKTTGMSPASLSGDALGDRVKEHYPNARVVSVGMKDRAVILMGGRRADEAYWFDYKTPAFISSTYYRFNPDVFSFNALVPGYLPATARWIPSPFIPAEELQRVTFDPPAAWPLKNTTYEGTFPHPIKVPRALTYSPLMHTMLLDFAQHVIATDKLGTHDGPDVLFVALSSTDYIGHYYGPDSMEVADSTVRLDRSLADFFDALERRFGDRVVVAMTSDHGVQSNPEIVKLRDPKADVGRIDIRTPVPQARKIADLPPTRIEIEEKLAAKLRIRFDRNAPLSHALVYFFEEPGLWLNWARVNALGLDHERTRVALRDVMRAMKHHGLADAWTSTELRTPNANASRIELLMRNSYRGDRSGDVLMALRPGWIWMWGSNSTTHGQPVENDMHVPLMFYGAGIKPGHYAGEASPLDLAATLGKLLGVKAGGRTSKVLPCVE
jgi:predicted AlkP superfamily pyrophosphatase or phosphodiesterase